MNSPPAPAGAPASGGRAFPARAAAGLALVFPAVVLLYDRAGGAVLHALSLLALLAMALPRLRGGGPGLRDFARDYGAFCAAMLMPLAANLLSQTGGGSWDDAFSSNVQRLVLAPLVLWLLLQVPAATLRHVQWSVAAGAFAATAMLLFLSWEEGTRPDPSSLNLLNYTNILVLLGCFSLCSLGWRLTRRPKLEAAIKLAAFAASLYAVVLSQSKGPLLALGALLVLCLCWQLRALSLRSRLIGAAVVLAACAAMALHVDRFKQGVHTAVDIVESIAVGTPADDALAAHGAGSISVRLGLWQASWQMFLERPWFGVGNKQFSEGLAELNAQGRAPDWAVWRPDRTPFTQAHSEFFNVLASTGVAGVLALLALYGVPLAYFVRRCRRGPEQTRVAGFMGVLLCVGFVLFGATVSLFSSTIVSTFYSIMAAIFLALSRAEAADPAAARRPDFLGGWADAALRRIYKRTHPRSYRHTRHLWPYVRCRRSAGGAIEAIRVAGVALPLVGVREAFAGVSGDFHVILSGPSVKEIDYGRLKLDAVMGVNGSIALRPEDPAAADAGPRFSHYCIIDHNFVLDRPALVRRVLDSELVLFVTPQVLRYVVQQQGGRPMRCRLCVIENIAERAGQPTPGPAALAAWQAAGRDIAVFDASECLGLSFEPDLGFFDADTVAYAALQILAWGGARRIVFHGLDINGAAGAPRFYESAQDRLETRLERNFARLIEPSFRQAAPLLAARGVQVLNLSPSSAIPAEIIPRADWRSLIPPVAAGLAAEPSPRHCPNV